MKKKVNGKRVVSKITLFVSAVLLMVVTFHSCQQDDFFEQAVPDGIALKSVTIENVIYPETFAGPVTLSPVKGKMITQTNTLENPDYDNYEAAFVLVVKNGDDSGLNKVMGANIYVNGVQVTTIADFRKAPTVIYWEISGLGQSTTLDVEVKGKTTGILTVWIEGVLKQAPLTETFTDARDGYVYKIVTIGEQTWMAENLAYLPSVNGVLENSTDEPRYYVYGYEGNDVSAAKATANYNTYGVYYNWTAAQTACPAGWHLPSVAEWEQLENYLIANGHNYDGTTEGNKIAKAMAARTNWTSNTTPNTPGNLLLLNNSSRFGAFGGGLKDYYGWLYIGNIGDWWTSTLSGTTGYWGDPEAWVEQINCNEIYSFRRDNGSTYNNGFNIRCVKDAE